MNLSFADGVHCANVGERLEIADAMDVAGALEQHDLIETMAVQAGRVNEVAILEALHLDRQWQRR